jgi:hypothetical protein
MTSGPYPLVQQEESEKKRGIGQGVFPFFSLFVLPQRNPMLTLRNFSGRSRKTEEASSATD